MPLRDLAQDLWATGLQSNDAQATELLKLGWRHNSPALSYVGWGGKTKHVQADVDLGHGTHRGIPPYGIRRMVWAAAMGYVSGFDKRDILYFLLTRCVSQRINYWTLRREGIEFRDGLPVGRTVSAPQSSGRES